MICIVIIRWLRNQWILHLTCYHHSNHYFWMNSLPNLVKFKKLVPNLFSKENYVTHYRNLKLYLKYGMKLIKIHRILQFKQSPWIKPYIDFNTDGSSSVYCDRLGIMSCVCSITLQCCSTINGQAPLQHARSFYV